jgi:hypothetical protein
MNHNKTKSMNTQLYLWLEPLIIGHKRGKGKLYFNCVIDGDHSKLPTKELEDVISGKTMTSIMDYADISSNWNYGVISAKRTNKKPFIEYTTSPEQEQEVKAKKEQDKKINKLVVSKKEIPITKSNLSIQDDGTIKVSLPELKVTDSINFPKIWETLESKFIGKIKEGSTTTVTDEHGNKIFEIRGGSFLNVGLAELSVYDKKKKPDNISLFNANQGLKGGAFIRDDGSIDVGDLKRTFYLRIFTNNLIKQALRLKQPISLLTTQKLLENKSKKGEK